LREGAAGSADTQGRSPPRIDSTARGQDEPGEEMENDVVEVLTAIGESPAGKDA
jgi:hypothetical protein